MTSEDAGAVENGAEVCSLVSSVANKAVNRGKQSSEQIYEETQLCLQLEIQYFRIVLCWSLFTENESIPLL